MTIFKTGKEGAQILDREDALPISGSVFTFWKKRSIWTGIHWDYYQRMQRKYCID